MGLPGKIPDTLPLTTTFPSRVVNTRWSRNRWAAGGAARAPAIAFAARESGNRADDFNCGHDDSGIVQDVEVESGAHVFIRVIRRCVLRERDVIAKSA